MEQKIRVFVVDDDVMTRVLLNEFLTRAEFSVNLLGSGKEALELLQSIQPDLLLLDVNMPEMNGLEVLRHLRSNPATKKLPVIFLTGSEFETDRVIEALDLDPSDFLTKLVSSKELIARIRWVLRRTGGSKRKSSLRSNE